MLAEKRAFVRNTVFRQYGYGQFVQHHSHPLRV
jgi:hypothetical protein